MVTPPPFAAIEALVNRGVMQHLANKNALIGTEIVQGIYDASTAIGAVGIGMASTQPTFTLLASDLFESPIGKTLVLDDEHYTEYIVASVDDDGSGMLRLMLEQP